MKGKQITLSISIDRLYSYDVWENIWTMSVILLQITIDRVKENIHLRIFSLYVIKKEKLIIFNKLNVFYVFFIIVIELPKIWKFLWYCTWYKIKIYCTWYLSIQANLFIKCTYCIIVTHYRIYLLKRTSDYTYVHTMYFRQKKIITNIERRNGIV